MSLPFIKRYDFPIHLFVLYANLGHRLSLLWNTCRTKLWLILTGCKFGSGLKVCGKPILKIARRGAISIGKNVTLQSRLRSNMAGGSGPVSLQCYDGGHISIGDHSGCSFASLSSRTSIMIGRHVSIGANTRIYDHDFHPLNPRTRRETPTGNVVSKSVTIEDDVFIGANTIILKGVTIGAGAVIGAGSVVTRSIPAGEIWAGNPACKVADVK